MEALRRVAGENPSGAYVIYHCRNSRGPGELRVSVIGSTYRPAVCWVQQGEELWLDEDEVEVFHGSTGASGK